MPDETTMETIDNPYGDGDVVKITSPTGAWHVHDPADDLAFCAVCRGLGLE